MVWYGMFIHSFLHSFIIIERINGLFLEAGGFLGLCLSGMVWYGIMYRRVWVSGCWERVCGGGGGGEWGVVVDFGVCMACGMYCACIIP